MTCGHYGSAGKESICNAADLGSIPGLERSLGEGKGYPLLYSDMENSMDGIVHGVAKSQARLRDFHFLFKTSSFFSLLAGYSTIVPTWLAPCFSQVSLDRTSQMTLLKNDTQH